MSDTTRRIRRRSTRAALVVAIAASCLQATVATTTSAQALPPGAPKIGMVCTSGSVSGSTRTFDLATKTGYIDTPDGNSIFMWSFVSTGAGDDGSFQSPGPVLCVNQGETVVIHLANGLPEASSVIFPGQDTAVVATGGTPGLLTTDAASNASVTYQFTAGRPGTYLYESGSDIAKQIEMGLYGALVVRPAGAADLAYDSATRFDPNREYLLLFSEIDPDLHHAVEVGARYDINNLRDRYFAINGREFPDTIQDNSSTLLPNQPYGSLVRIQPTTARNPLPALVRMVNAGLLNHPFHPHGNHTSQIAQDGRRLRAPGGQPTTTEHFAETIGAGQTQDFLLRWVDQDHWDPQVNPLPVPPPDYRNVTFKDANTWYSGSPYLGYKGTLPTGTVSQNICGEWYFPWHSHALNEFTNYDQGFGGMGTLLRVDPPGGCFAAPSAAAVLTGVLADGDSTDLAGDDDQFYKVAPPATRLAAGVTATATTMQVTSASGFPTSGNFYVRLDNEVLQVTGGQGTTTWTVSRGTLSSTAAAHATRTSVTGLANDWYASFSGVVSGSQNLRLTVRTKNCSGPVTTSCAAFPSNQPSQTVRICDWTIAGAAGCDSATGAGWVTLPSPPPQPVRVGETEVSRTWTLPGSANHYIGTGTNKNHVRVLVHTDRYTAPRPAIFSTWGDLVALTYDAP